MMVFVPPSRATAACLLFLMSTTTCRVTAFISPRMGAQIYSVQLQRSPIQQPKPHDSNPLFSLLEHDNGTPTETLFPQSTGFLSNILLPAAKALNDATGGFALSYADLSPETEQTWAGQAFLATNLAYAILGLACWYCGDAWFGSITEAASVASFAYHYNQLSNPKDMPVVRLVLMIDYLIAFSCLGTAFYYLITDPMSVPLEGYIASVLSLMFLGFSWKWESGVAYCFNHGLWHLLGAYGGYLIAQAHASTLSTLLS